MHKEVVAKKIVLARLGSVNAILSDWRNLGIEVRVVDSLLGTDTASRIVNEEHLEQIETVVAKNLGTIDAYDLFVMLSLPLWKAALEVWKACHSRPVILRWGAKDAEDLEDLVNL